MKDKVTQIDHSELFEIFENESIEESFIASADIRNILLSENIPEEDILNYPYLTNDLIIIIYLEGYFKAKVDWRNYTLEKGSLLVIMPKQVFEIRDISPDADSIVYIMKKNFWDNNIDFFETIELKQHFFKESGFRLSENRLNEAVTLYHLIKQKLTEKHLFSRQIIQHYISVMFYNVYAQLQQQYKQKSKYKLHTKEYFFEQFMRLVERHFKEERQITFYAEKLHLTSKYLSEVIRSVSGMTAGQWIQEYLIIESRALLKMGKMSIKQISNELNFYDQSHFGVFFKKHVGCSPKAYQKR